MPSSNGFLCQVCLARASYILIAMQASMILLLCVYMGSITRYTLAILVTELEGFHKQEEDMTYINIM